MFDVRLSDEQRQFQKLYIGRLAVLLQLENHSRAAPARTSNGLEIAIEQREPMANTCYMQYAATGKSLDWEKRVPWDLLNERLAARFPVQPPSSAARSR